MALETIEEIEQAIGQLTPRQLEELCQWLDRHHPQPLDARTEADLAAGLLDKAIERALSDEAGRRTRPL